MCYCPDRSKATLLRLIQAHVEPGTKVKYFLFSYKYFSRSIKDNHGWLGILSLSD